MRRTPDISYGLAQIAKSLDDMGRKPWAGLVREAGERIEEMKALLDRFHDLDADPNATDADWSRLRRDVSDILGYETGRSES